MTDNIQTVLENNFMLVSIHIAKPPKTRTDKRASAESAAKHGAARGKIRAVKDIWGSGATQMILLNNLLDAARTTHDKLTGPWTAHEGVKSGWQLLKNERFFEYVKAMNVHKAGIQSQLDAIESNYDAIIAESMAELGDLADPSLYPSFEGLRNKVSLRFQYRPIPASTDFERVNLPANVVEKMVAMAEQTCQMEVDNLIRTAWEGVLTPLTRIVTQTSKEKGKIFDSLYESLRVVVANLADFNIKDDPEMEKTRRELVRIMSVYSLEDVRKDPIARADLNEDAKRVVESMANLGWAA